MCGICGVVHLEGAPVPRLAERLSLMNVLQSHRGPDGAGQWTHPSDVAGFGHRRLQVLDLQTGSQPMRDAASGCVLTFNGEIYNYRALRTELGESNFRSASDTEVVLRAWLRWGPECLSRLRGMFAFAIWDERDGTCFAARDRFGIKPFYYAVVREHVYFASEAKALLPFLPKVATDVAGLRDYLTFQLCLGGKTMFAGVRELPPGHSLTVRNAKLSEQRYWDVRFEPDYAHPAAWFEERTRALIEDSVRVHMQADVPIGAYLSGGLDSGVVAGFAAKHDPSLLTFTGTYRMGPDYDEAHHAEAIAAHLGVSLQTLEITVDDFLRDLPTVIYHLDYPVAGPGSFSQFEVAGLAAMHRKVVLGGQGGDEIFGGYARYLLAYFEQCIKAAIDGTADDGNFIVRYESIIPNLTVLRNYKPMMQEFWREGLFAPMAERYFRLVNRAPHLGDAIRWDEIGALAPISTFLEIFDAPNLQRASYFDRMTHFDFKTQLPALLHVEDRMSMAHGVEARVPLLDHPLVEFAATIPANIKFTDGELKRSLLQVSKGLLPTEVTRRKDKMGFPTPFIEWVQGPARDFIGDTLSTSAARNRQYVDNSRVLELVFQEPRFGRNLWGLLSLELWQQAFHDIVVPFESSANRDRIRTTAT